VTRPIFESEFWAERLRTAKEPHHSVFVCPKARWDAIAANHRKILSRHLQDGDAVLEAGCGWGRLVDLLPPGREINYVGVDLSPDFIALAKERYGVEGRTFFVGDLRNLPAEVTHQSYDWCVMVSVRGMVIREAGAAEWDVIERELRRVAKRILVLEYDENEEGVVIV
jgi:cyclopropane fatty-acyl-phospholipid synthase-like methyltransferase